MKKNKEIREMGEAVFVVDCDDSLIMYDLSEHEGEDVIKINNPYSKMDLSVVINQKNVNTVIKFKKLGYYVIVWSRTGKLWAEAVADAVGLRMYIDQTLAKPMYYLDDKECSEWMGERVYRDPNSIYGS